MAIVQSFESPRTFFSDPGIRKRAYKLARSGGFKDLSEISRRLELEGFVSARIQASLDQQTTRADLQRILRIANDT